MASEARGPTLVGPRGARARRSRAGFEPASRRGACLAPRGSPSARHRSEFLARGRRQDKCYVQITTQSGGPTRASEAAGVGPRPREKRPRPRPVNCDWGPSSRTGDTGSLEVRAVCRRAAGQLVRSTQGGRGAFTSGRSKRLARRCGTLHAASRQTRSRSTEWQRLGAARGLRGRRPGPDESLAKRFGGPRAQTWGRGPRARNAAGAERGASCPGGHGREGRGQPAAPPPRAPPRQTL